MNGMLTMTVMPTVGGEDEMYLIYDNEANRVRGKDEMYLLDDNEVNRVRGEDLRNLINDGKTILVG